MSSTTYEFDDDLLDIAEFALVGSAANKSIEEVFGTIEVHRSFCQSQQSMGNMRFAATIDVILKRLTQGNKELYRSVLGYLQAISDAESANPDSIASGQ